MKDKEEFKKILLNDTYIKWLHVFMKDKNKIDNYNYIIVKNIFLSDNDYEMIEYLEFLYKELKIYYAKNIETTFNSFCLKYKNNYYVLKNYSKSYQCTKYNTPLYLNREMKQYSTIKNEEFIIDYPYVEYEDIKKQYEIEDIANATNIEITPLQVLIKKIIDNPNKFYTDIYDNLTPEEKLFINENLENKSCLNCTNNNCKIESWDKLKLDEDNKPQGQKCISWQNDLLVGKSKVLKIKDINKLN